MALSRERLIACGVAVRTALQSKPDLTSTELQTLTQISHATLMKVLKMLQDQGDVKKFKVGRVVHYRLSSPKVVVTNESLKHSAPTVLGAELLGTTLLQFFPHGFVKVFADYLSLVQLRMANEDPQMFAIVMPELLDRLAMLVNFFNTAGIHLSRGDLNATDYFKDRAELEKFLGLDIAAGFHLGKEAVDG